MKNGNGHHKVRVGVIGLGAVGKTLAHALSWYHDVTPYDIEGDYLWEPILSTDLVLVCVSTPLGADGRLDCRNVEAVLRRLEQGNYDKPVAVRSTVKVGYMARAVAVHPALRLVYFPEFIRERSRLQWTVCPDRLVLAGDERDVRVILSAFKWVEDAPILRMSFYEAELGKLANNAFIATKVSFTNEIERICQMYDADPEKVMQVITTDRRVISREHLGANKGPYDGPCIPKDTHELMTAGGGSPVLAAAEQVRESLGGSPRPAHVERQLHKAEHPRLNAVDESA
jgi:UDPglucose 6-dehydrogenase